MLRISTSRRTITPSGYAHMAGYGSAAPREAVGSYTDLHATALACWQDGATRPRVFVSVDVLGIPASLDTAVRALTASWGLPTADLVITATHTHNGPLLLDTPDPWTMCGVSDLTPVQTYQTWLAEQLADLISQVADPLTPQIQVNLDYQVANQSWAVNRAGLSYKETAVPVLAFRAATGGQPVAVLFGYGCHPVSAGGQTRWDGDYPAAAAAVIEAAVPGCTALFVPGPAGDQNPSGTWSWRRRDQLGASLGAAVVDKLASTGRSLTSFASTATLTATCALDITDTPSNLAGVRQHFVDRLANPALPVWYHRHAQLMINQIDAHSFAMNVPVPVTAWRLAGSPELRLAFLGGELVAGYAAWARVRYGGVNGVNVGGYANACQCYLPNNELLPPLKTGSSYEGGFDADFPNMAGGSMTIYPHLGRFKATGSVEDTLCAALTALLT